MTDYLAEAERHLEMAARHLTEHPSDMRIAEVAAWIGQGYATLALLNSQQAAEPGAEQPGKRYRLTTQHLGTVAAVYQEADKDGRGPTQAVATYFNVPYHTATKWIGHARKRGLLKPWTVTDTIRMGAVR